MITEQHYIDGQHPIDMIWGTKTFLNELQKTMDDRFEDLVKKLGFNEEGTDWLFDYIYNNGDDFDFEEYLEKFDSEVTYERCLKHQPKQEQKVPLQSLKKALFRLTVMKAGKGADKELAEGVKGVRDRTILCNSCGDIALGEPLTLWAPSRDFEGGLRLIQTSPVVKVHSWTKDGAMAVEVLTKSGSVYRVEELSIDFPLHIKL